MNLFVADPHWGWWIIWYFYLGGIAAGAYFIAALAEVFGDQRDRQLAGLAYLLAAPLVAICGLLLIVDLNYPERFWHMLLDAQIYRPHMKIWSPMSIGAWALLVFGVLSGVSFVRALRRRARPPSSGGLASWSAIPARILLCMGIGCGFFIASYTGVLLTATNQPLWSTTPWIGALFLASSAATGSAALRLLLLWTTRGGTSVGTTGGTVRGPADFALSPVHRRLDRIEPWTWTLELLAAVLLSASLGPTALRSLWSTGVAWSFLGGAIGIGIGVPIVVHWLPHRSGRGSVIIAAAAVLWGGLCLRYSVLVAPSAFTLP